MTALDTPHLTLRGCTPAQLLALVDQADALPDLVGVTVSQELRGFYASGDVSPTWLAALRGATAPDVWRHGFFVVEREDARVIGSAGFKGPPDSAGMVEIAYGIVPSRQGRGYATEVARALVTFALATPGVRLVRAHTLREANASTRVLTKCGFRHLGTVEDPEDGPVWRWELGGRPE